MRRTTHCPQGHERTPENLTKNRDCKICSLARIRRWQQSPKGKEAMRVIAARHYEKVSKSPKWRKQASKRVVHWQKTPVGKAILRARRMKWQYGITVDQFDTMLISQQGRCAICSDQFANSPRAPHIDHDHQTKRVRGLLCEACNQAIGLLRESRANFEAAIAYLMLPER
jgi:hypothetical protein